MINSRWKRQHVLRSRIDSSQARLHEAGLLTPLHDVAESQNPLTDDTLEPLNRAYYALRMPCPFLEDEHCTIYDERPAACRELLVTSAAELCQDLTNPAIQAVPVSVRISTTLGLLWAELTGTAERLIPLPSLSTGPCVIKKTASGPGQETNCSTRFYKVWRYLSQECIRRQSAGDK